MQIDAMTRARQCKIRRIDTRVEMSVGGVNARAVNDVINTANGLHDGVVCFHVCKMR